MKIDIIMPEMGESITEGTIAKWLKKSGDPVERDEAILEITTDKIDSEIPSPGDGVLAEILVEEGNTIEVGTVLARVETKGTALGPVEVPEEAPQEERIEPEKMPEEASATRISPVARNVATAQGLSEEDLSSISGSGQGGRITKADVVEFLEEREDAGVPDRVSISTEGQDGDGRIEIIQMSTMRKTIAERMVLSKHTSPHTYTVAEVDMTKIVKFRERIKNGFQKEEGFKLTYTPFILHAAVGALKAYPLVNASLKGDQIIRKDFINLGVAVALESGLIVPVIKGADEKNLLGLARSAYDLAVRAQNKRLMPDEVQGGTFTVTNPGIFGNIFGLPIINQPQLGILGVGSIKKRPVVINDAIAIRSIMYLSLSYDHRIIDGSLAAQFVQKIRAILEDYDTEHAL